MGLAATFVLNGMLGVAAYGMARDGFRQPAGLIRALAAVVLGWTWATLGMETLGAAGWIGLLPLVAWTGLGLVIAGTVRLRRSGEDLEVPPAKAAAASAWEWESVAALGLAIWGTSFIGVRSLMHPVKVVSDGPIYHLYFAARWWKEGRLSLIATPFGETAATYFPAVGDLWFAWLMTAWGGDRLAKVGQAPFLLAAGLAAYALARQLGARASSAVIAVAWFVTVTPLLLFSFEANVDTIFIAGYLLAVLFFVRYAMGDGGAAELTLGALAAGGALGTKAVGIVFVPPLLVMAALAVVCRRAPQAEKAAHLLVVATAPWVMAGFWYGRNAWLTGNPLYPLHLASGGLVWLSGWYGPDAMKTSPYYLSVDNWRACCDILLAVFDPRLVPIWIAALVGLWAPGGPKSRADRWVWALSALAVLNVALYWLVVPYRTQQRFMLQALGLAAVPLARLLDRGRWLRVVATGLLAVHLLTALSWPFDPAAVPWVFSPVVPRVTYGIMAIERSDLPPPGAGSSLDLRLLEVGRAAIGLAALVAAWRWSRLGRPPTRRGWLLAALSSAVVVGLAVAVFSPRPWDPRHPFYPRFREYYFGWLDLESRVGPAGARIAYAGTNLPYYLMGSGLRNEVRSINVDGHRGWLMHDYHREARSRGQPVWPTSRPGWDRLHPDYDAWLANLRAERIQLLFVTPAKPEEGEFNLADAEGFPIERVWADAHPETFELLYGPEQGDPEVRIYRVRPS